MASTKGGRNNAGGARDAAADHRQPVDQRQGLGDGVAGHFAQTAKGLDRGRAMAGRLADADFIDRLRLGGLVRRQSGDLGVNPADGADAGPFLGVDRRDRACCATARPRRRPSCRR